MVISVLPNSSESCNPALRTYRINSAPLFLGSWFESLAVARIRCSLSSCSGLRFLIHLSSFSLFSMHVFSFFSSPSVPRRGGHPAVLQSILEPAQCERKQLPNLHWRRLLGGARSSPELKSTAVPTAHQVR